MLALPPSVAGLVSVSLATSVSCICSCNCIRIRCVEEHLRVEPTRTASVISGHWDWSCYCSGIACVCCCRLISSSPEFGPSVWATFLCSHSGCSCSCSWPGWSSITAEQTAPTTGHCLQFATLKSRFV